MSGTTRRSPQSDGPTPAVAGGLTPALPYVNPPSQNLRSFPRCPLRNFPNSLAHAYDPQTPASCGASLPRPRMVFPHRLHAESRTILPASLAREIPDSRTGSRGIAPAISAARLVHHAGSRPYSLRGCQREKLRLPIRKSLEGRKLSQISARAGQRYLAARLPRPRSAAKRPARCIPLVHLDEPSAKRIVQESVRLPVVRFPNNRLEEKNASRSAMEAAMEMILTWHFSVGEGRVQPSRGRWLCARTPSAAKV